MADCCDGNKSTKWHDRRGIPRCRESKDLRNLRMRNFRAGIDKWIPGSPILVPEIDPL